MTYTKPEVVLLNAAITAVQHVDKGSETPIDGNPDFQTPNGYEADE